MAPPENIIAKVQKLLEMREDRGCSPEEAAAAAAAAQRLMTKHAITEAMLEVEVEEEPAETAHGAHDPVFNGKQAPTWIDVLMVHLARANGCQHYWARGARQEKYRIVRGICLRLVGRDSDVAAVTYLFQYCRREVERVTQAALDEYRALYGEGAGRTWTNNFRLGCVDSIGKAIRAERDAVVAEMRAAAATGSALVVVDRGVARLSQRLDDAQAWARKHLRLRSRGGGAAAYDPSARNAGRQAGKGIYPGRGGRPGVGAGARRLGGGT